MRIVMIHALAGSIHPAKLVNAMDDSLLADFGDSLTSNLRGRMSQLIYCCAEHGADAVGLACSVHVPVVDSARNLVDIPVLSSYDAISYCSRIGIIAWIPATLRDSKYYL